MNCAKEVWKEWRDNRVIEKDSDVVLMLTDLVSTLHLLENIYGVKEAHIFTRGIIQDWYNLSMIAMARNLKDYDRP